MWVPRGRILSGAFCWGTFLPCLPAFPSSLQSPRILSLRWGSHLLGHTHWRPFSSARGTVSGTEGMLRGACPGAHPRGAQCSGELNTGVPHCMVVWCHIGAGGAVCGPHVTAHRRSPWSPPSRLPYRFGNWRHETSRFPFPTAHSETCFLSKFSSVLVLVPPDQPW